MAKITDFSVPAPLKSAVLAINNTSTKVTHVSFQKTHCIYSIRYLPLFLLGFAPICPFFQQCHFFAPYFFTLSLLRISGHYGVKVNPLISHQNIHENSSDNILPASKIIFKVKPLKTKAFRNELLLLLLY